MNLGLEDAWIFAELVRANRLADYNRLRRPVDGRVVRRVAFVSRIIAAESAFERFVRDYVFPMALKVPFLPTRLVGAVTGLDHELPDPVPGGRPTLAAVATG